MSSVEEYPYKQVDVFSVEPFLGNPVGVFFNADNLTAEQMQKISKWMNLSECTFILKPSHPDADYRVRIFNPESEMSFAGHPTLGTAHAILESVLIPKKKNRLVQECKAGLVNVYIENEICYFSLPKSDVSTISQLDLQALATALKINGDKIIKASRVDVGASWLTAKLDSAETVLSLKPDMKLLTDLSHKYSVTGITVYGEKVSDAASIETRSFAPAVNVPEDPVCGSGNGCIAALVSQEGLPYGSSYKASQGSVVGRQGFVHIKFENTLTLVGGRTSTLIEGKLRLGGS